MTLEILNRAFVFFRRSLAVKRAEIFLLAVRASFLREYSRHLPDFSFLIMNIPPHDSRRRILGL
jgi:hypothetical protein